MELDAGMCRLRPFAPADRERLAEVANDQRIWRNLTRRFPHPYTLQHADEWIELCAVSHGKQPRVRQRRRAARTGWHHRDPGRVTLEDTQGDQVRN